MANKREELAAAVPDDVITRHNESYVLTLSDVPAGGTLVVSPVDVG